MSSPDICSDSNKPDQQCGEAEQFHQPVPGPEAFSHPGIFVRWGYPVWKLQNLWGDGGILISCFSSCTNFGDLSDEILDIFFATKGVKIDLHPRVASKSCQRVKYHGALSAQKKMHSTLNMRSPLGPIDKLKMLRTIGSKTNYNFQWKMWLKNAGHFQEMKTNRDLPPAATGWLEWAARINGRAKIENTARMKSPGFSTKQFELSWCVFLLHVFFGLLAVHISLKKKSM